MHLAPIVTCDVDCDSCPRRSQTIYHHVLEERSNTVKRIRKGAVHLRANQTIARAGERSPLTYTIYSGWAYYCLLFPDGRRQIIRFLIPGDMICFAGMFDTPMLATARTLTDVTLCTFDVKEMHALLSKEDEVQASFNILLMESVDCLLHRLADIGQRRAKGRIAKFLLEIEKRLRDSGLSKDGEFDFPPRQEHIADALGLTPVHVNRTLAQLRKENVIDFRRGAMRILDFEALNKIAEED